MHALVVERFAYTPHGTLGRAILPSGVELFSLEPPWKNNEPNVSCIPEGEYTAVRDRGGRHQFYRVEDVPGRSAIEIHPANYFVNPATGRQELWGCIAFGLGLNTQHIASVARSVDACNRLVAEMGETGFELTIKQFRAA
jgi:hypothetical protein